jgi:DNA polymerase-3 subunit alpha
MKIVSVANTDGFYYKPRIDHELLAKHSKGLIGASACLGGEIPNFILKGDNDGALSRAALYRDILGDGNFFLELQHNSIQNRLSSIKAYRDSKEGKFPADSHQRRALHAQDRLGVA